MSDELEERLRGHAQSFDSLLSLIPAKLYYGEDVSDQYKRKKQTPEQKRAAKMAKLDPDNWKSAKDVLDERAVAAKRKRDESVNGSEDGPLVEQEKPKLAQDQENPKTKKRKTEATPTPNQATHALTVEEKKQKKAEKKAAKKEKVQKEKERQQRQKARKQADKLQKQQEAKIKADDTKMAEPVMLDQEAMEEVENADEWSTASSSDGVPEILSPPAESGASSTSSLPLSATDQHTKAKATQSKQTTQLIPKIPQSSLQTLPIQTSANRDAAKARLADAISSFRSARKADEPSTNKPRNRAELLEQRRRKEEVKRLAKKEQKRKEREEAVRIEDEEIAKRFSPGGSGSLLSSPRSPPGKEGDPSFNNFSYGRIEFSDGTKIDPSDPSSLLNRHKRKGPQDTQTALLAAQKKASRLSGLDEDKRKSIEEKDMWLAAKQRAHGERVKDNTSLLKKALKRQENQKKKSGKEWDDRKEGIAKSQEAQQRKRTENIAKRREEKLSHKFGGKKVKKLPGFGAGSFIRSGGGKKRS